MGDQGKEQNEQDFLDETEEAVNRESDEEIAEEIENETADEETVEETTEDENLDESVTQPKKGFFGKSKKEKKDKKDLQIEELTDKYKRTMAEFDNFRKRTEKEKSQMYEVGAREVIEKILPVIDNFERGLASISEEEKSSPFVEGIDMIYKQLMKVLEDIGVRPIEAVGKEFDPEFHNAVMQGEDEEQGENIITEEYQKGYMYRETVVRHSMVKVVNC